jgi:AraC-like DNA-binding protein
VGHYKVVKGYEEKPLLKNFVQVFWCIEGCGSFIVEGRKYLLKPKYAIYYLKEERHLIKAESDIWSYRWFSMDGDMNEDLIRSFALPRRPFYAGTCPEELFMELESEIFDISPFGQRRASCTVYSLLALSAGQRPKEDASDLIVQKCVSAINENYKDPFLNINSLSGKLNIHRTTLSKVFKKKMGVSPIEYLVSIRMQKALSLLKETSFTIAEIAEQTGYSDSNYFSKAVRKTIGLSPGKFRKQ